MAKTKHMRRLSVYLNTPELHSLVFVLEPEDQLLLEPSTDDVIIRFPHETVRIREYNIAYTRLFEYEVEEKLDLPKVEKAPEPSNELL